MVLTGGGGGLGLVAAMSAPAAGAFGMLIWDGAWKGSPFALNLYKSFLASGVFLAVLAVSKSLPAISLGTAGPLYLSAMLGIVVGDLIWLSGRFWEPFLCFWVRDPSLQH